ncbi:carboxypeptidase regulatory-like domain-containing protein [Novipirellula rosea]|uniref:Carboxypeptidase regulatory-like domain-containing protein n=1 Tax=Novipirellula rosea TaxID=1031540 RepID=A0ABP8MHG0_9BACT|tara:strand:+ start:9838 stop:10311 length:474 start_codon:yes stop_codon:yes gene_type:complete
MYRIAFFCVLLAVVSGCASEEKPDGLPVLHPAEITVHQGGAPLVGASVQLISTDPTLSRWVSGGSTNENGEAVVMTHGKYVGVPAGKFKVTVNKTQIEGAAAGNDPGSSNEAKMFDLVEAKYRAVTTTPIEVEISAGDNKLDVIEVGAPVKDAAAKL